MKYNLKLDVKITRKPSLLERFGGWLKGLRARLRNYCLSRRGLNSYIKATEECNDRLVEHLDEELERGVLMADLLNKWVVIGERAIRREPVSAKHISTMMADTKGVVDDFFGGRNAGVVG